MTALTLDRLQQGGKRAMAEALALIESAPLATDTIALLDEAFSAPHGVIIGITGPPGVGKSTLTDGIVSRLRASGKTVAVIAIDPSSVRTGGALLGDRARFASVDPLDRGVFVRSMATRGRLGGLSDLVFPAMILMQAVYDVVLVETVGVGQSEIEIAGLADRTVLCVQPASGDSLQFLKSGVMEVPDMILVTKSDLGGVARRAAADLRSALSVTQRPGADLKVVLCSSQTGEGMDEAVETMSSINLHAYDGGAVHSRRMAQGLLWHRQVVAVEFGKCGLALADKICNQPNMYRMFERHATVMTLLMKAFERLKVQECR